MFQIRPGDVLIQSNKIIGFLHGEYLTEMYLICFPVASLIGMDEIKFGQNNNEDSDIGTSDAWPRGVDSKPRRKMFGFLKFHCLGYNK